MFQCPTCGKTCATSRDLANHIKLSKGGACFGSYQLEAYDKNMPRLSDLESDIEEEKENIWMEDIQHFELESEPEDASLSDNKQDDNCKYRCSL